MGEGNNIDEGASFGESVSKAKSFVSTLNEELRENKSLQNIKDANDLANQFINAQKLIGQKVAEPEGGDDYYNFYNKLGRPESVDGYEFDIPEDLGIDPKEIHEKYSKAFHEAGLTKKQASILAAKQMEEVKAQLSKNQELREEVNKDFLKKAFDKFGGEEGWAKTSAEVQQWLVNNVDDDIRSEFKDLDNKTLLTIIAPIKKMLDSMKSEDGPLSTQSGDNTSMSLQEIDNRMREIYKDPSFREHSYKGQSLVKEFNELSAKKAKLQSR